MLRLKVATPTGTRTACKHCTPLEALEALDDDASNNPVASAHCMLMRMATGSMVLSTQAPARCEGS